MYSSGGRGAWAVLAHGHGQVLAVFRSCVYLQAGGSLCCAGDASLVDGPMNLRLADRERLIAALAHCDAGAPWSYRDRALRLGRAPGIAVHRPVIWDARARAAPEPHTLSCGLRACRAALAAETIHDTGTARFDAAHDTITQRIRDALQDGMRALARWLHDALDATTVAASVPAQVLALLGTGPGLTPSGDDLLTGALVTLHTFDRPDIARRLGEAITIEAPMRTGRISAAHLAAACNGEAIAPVHALLAALRNGDAPACTARTRALLRHGHSSGADALAGITLTATALVDQQFMRGQRCAGHSPASRLLHRATASTGA